MRKLGRKAAADGQHRKSFQLTNVAIKFPEHARINHRKSYQRNIQELINRKTSNSFLAANSGNSHYASSDANKTFYAGKQSTGTLYLERKKIVDGINNTVYQKDLKEMQGSYSEKVLPQIGQHNRNSQSHTFDAYKSDAF